MPSASDELTSPPLATDGKIIGCALFLIILFAPNPDPQNLNPAAQRLAAVTVLMGFLWLTQGLPIPATSLIPVALFPLLGIESARDVAKAYFDRNIMLFLGGFIVALGIAKWGLHRRMALHIVRMIGTSPRLVVLGFMLATAFLSMWISNTASTLLMLPVGLALIASFEQPENVGGEDDPAKERFAVVLMLGIAYAASIGGLTTLVGTPTNIQFVRVWEEAFSKELYAEAPEIPAGQWMTAIVPIGVVMLGITWCVLTFRLPRPKNADHLSRKFFTAQLRQLGTPTRAEWLMLVVFATTAALWMFRTPLKIGDEPILPGWSEWVAHQLAGWSVTEEMLHDSTVAIGMAIVMFAIPARRDESGRTEYLMDWQTAAKVPWGILLLIGGGFAIADAFQSTGLSTWLGDQFAQALAGQNVWLLVAGTCFLLTFLTEFTSNVATVSALLPVLAGAAISMEIDPRLVMIPATLSASCAFMLPIATPPNAIVFGSGRLQMGQMVRYGVFLNLIGVVVITLGTYFILVPRLGIEVDKPNWLTPAEESPNQSR